MVSCIDCQYISVCNEAQFQHGVADIHSNYFCEDFKPKLVEKCSYCGQIINQPVYAWPYWNESDPVCSSYCLRQSKRGVI